MFVYHVMFLSAWHTWKQKYFLNSIVYLIQAPFRNFFFPTGQLTLLGMSSLLNLNSISFTFSLNRFKSIGEKKKNTGLCHSTPQEYIHTLILKVNHTWVYTSDIAVYTFNFFQQWNYQSVKNTANYSVSAELCSEWRIC